MSEHDPKTAPDGVRPADASHELPEDAVGEALTDDDRVSREKQTQEKGSRVQPGPADEARLSKT